MYFLDDSNETNENDNDVNNNLKLDFVKLLNTSNITYNNPTEADLNIGLSAKLNAGNKSITLSIDWKLFCNYGYEKICSDGIEDFQIVGFSKKIKGIFIDGVGQTSVETSLFYLMEDGSVYDLGLIIIK